MQQFQIIEIQRLEHIWSRYKRAQLGVFKCIREYIFVCQDLCKGL